MSFQKIKCRVGLHSPLHVIHRFGSAALVGCATCNREFAMHDGQRAWAPWRGDFEELYTHMGYDIAASRTEWHKKKRPYPVNQLGSWASPPTLRQKER